MDGGAFIRELCLAIEYRWIPEKLFVLFTAHFDEADTHGAAPKMAMGALLGDGREWTLFSRRLNAIRRAEGFRIFHATKFKAGKGEFEGWDDPKNMRLISDLTTLIQKTLTEGVLINLPYERYVAEYRQTPTPKGIDLVDRF